MTDPIVTLSEVAKTFSSPAGSRPVLSNISFSIGRGEAVAVMGPNGVGKSTLANIVAGVDEDFEGTIARASGMRQQSPMVQQDYRASLLPWLSLEANIGFPLLLRGVSKEARTQAVRDILKQAPARLDASVPVSKLSGGQAQLACVLRGFIEAPDLLVCDEPFSAIDYPARIMLRALIARTCHARGTSLLFVSHSIDDTVYLADRIVVLRGQPASIDEEIVIDETGSRDGDWLDGERSADFRRRVRAALERS